MVEIENLWLLGTTLVSGDLIPFSGTRFSIGSESAPFKQVFAHTYTNGYGDLMVNDVSASAPLTRHFDQGVATLGLNIDSSLRIVDDHLSLSPQVLFEDELNTTAPITRKLEDGDVTIGLKTDNTLTVNPQGELGVRERILLPSNIEFDFADPLHFELDPTDQVGGHVTLKASDKDFKINDEGFLETIDLDLTGQGAIGIRKADWSLGETDVKLRVIRLDVSSQFQQTNGVLDIRSQGAGRVPFYQINSGFATNSNFTFDSATTLSVPFIKLTQSYELSQEYAASVGFVHYAYQAEVGTGIEIAAPVNNRRIVKIRCDPSSLLVDGSNNLAVKIDPSGALKKDASLGLDLKIDPSGSIKLDPGLGIDTRLNPAGALINETGIGLNIKVDPSGGLKIDPGLGLDVRTDPSGSIKVDPGLGLDVRLHPTGAIQNIAGMGLSVKTDPSGVIFHDLAGLDVKVAPTSGLSKGTLGLQIDVDESGVIFKDVLGIDCRVDEITIVKTLGRICGNYKAGNGLTLLGNTFSVSPELEKKVDDVADGLDDVAEASEQARNVAENAKTLADNAAKTAADLTSKIGDLASVVDGVGDLAKTIGISVGTSVLTSTITTGISAAALGLAASNSAQNVLSNNVGKAIGVGAAFAGLFGAIGGAIGNAIGKKGNQNTYISYNSYSNGGMKEKESDDEEDTYYYGYSITCGTNYSVDLYPDRTLAPCTVTPLLGSDLQPVESINSRSGQLTVAGGVGVSGNIHGGKDIYANNLKVATESFVTSQLTPYATQSYVTGRGYITLSALGPYLTSVTATSTYQPIISAGSNIVKTTNILSLSPDVSISTLDVGAMFSVKKTPWTEPTMTANTQNGYVVSCSSAFASNYDAWYAFNKAGGSWYCSDGRYASTAPFAYIGNNVTTANGISYSGEWLQFRSNVSVYLTSYTLDAAAVAQTPVSFVLLGSKDGSTWTLLDTQTDLIWSGTSRRTFNISVSVSYTYFRIVCRQALATYVGFGEFKMTGYVEELKSRSETFTWNGMNVATTTDINSALTPYSTTTQMNSAITSALTPYSTTTQMNSAISSALTPYSTTTQMNSAITSALTPYSTTTQMNSAITSALMAYSTTTQVNSAISSALTPYSTTTQMNSAITTALTPYVTNSGLTSALSTYVTNSGLTSALSTYVTNSGLTSALSTYVTNSSLNSALGSYLTIATAASTYQPILTAGTGLTKTGSTLSINAAQTGITSLGTLTGLTSSGNVNIGESVTPANATRSLNLISATGAVIRIWRNSDVANNNPSVELLWGAGDTPKLWWDFFVNSTGSFVIRDRIGGNNDRLLVNSSGNVVIPSTAASSSTTSGALQVAGGAGIGGSLYAANMFIGTNPVATQSYVTGLGYITSSALTPYLTTTTAASTYQPILTVGAGLTKSVNTVSLNQDVSVNSISAAGFSSNSVYWYEPNMSSLSSGGYTVSASSTNASFYAWRCLDSSEVDIWQSAANFVNSNPSPTLSASTTVSGTAIRGEWWQLQVPVPTMISSYSIKANSATLPNRAPTAWLFCGSSDGGATWEQIDSQAGQSSWTSTNLTLTFNITQSKPYTYFRFIFQKTSGTFDVFVAVKRIRFIGYQANLKWYTSRIPTVEELSQKANTFSVTSPLTLSNSTIGIDLSSYLMSTTAASTYVTIATASSTYEPILTAGTGLIKAGGVMSVDSTKFQNKLGLVAPLEWTGTGNTLQINQAGITQVGKLLQTEISTSGMLLGSDSTSRMTALRLSATSNSFDGVALSLDASWLGSTAKNWTVQSLSDGNLSFNANSVQNYFFKNDGNMYILGPGGTSYTVSLYLKPWSGRSVSPVRLCGVDDGAGGGYFRLDVASGDSSSQPTEVLRATTQKTNVYNQLHIQNTSIATGSFGVPFTVNPNTSAFTVEGSSVFNGTILINPVRTTPSGNSAWRWVKGVSDSSWNGWSSSGAGNVSVFMGATRFMIASGGEINLVSDRKMKKCIEPLKNALDAVERIPACSYQYKAVPDKTTYGFIAQEVAEVFPELVDTAISPENETSLVLNQMPLIAVLWGGLRELAAKVRELEMKK